MITISLYSILVLCTHEESSRGKSSRKKEDNCKFAS